MRNLTNLQFLVIPALNVCSGPNVKFQKQNDASGKLSIKFDGSSASSLQKWIRVHKSLNKYSIIRLFRVFKIPKKKCWTHSPPQSEVADLNLHGRTQGNGHGDIWKDEVEIQDMSIVLAVSYTLGLSRLQSVHSLLHSPVQIQSCDSCDLEPW